MAIPIFQSEARFPQNLGALHYTRCVEFDDPRLGIQMHYASPDGIKADTYLYDLGRADLIPDDIMSPMVTEMFEGARGDVFKMVEQGLTLDLQSRTPQYLTLPDDATLPTYLWAAFSYRQAPGSFTTYEGTRFSHLALRTDFGCINKVRYTYPDTLAESAAPGLLEFLFDWHESVQLA